MSIRIAALAAIGLLAAGCHVNADAEDREAGAEVTRNYQVGSFNKIAIAGPYNVKVVSGGGGGGAITAKGGENLLAETDVIVEGDTLKIMPKKRKGLRWNWRGGKAEFMVNAAALRGASIAGSGELTVDRLAGDFEGDVAGSGDMRLGEVSGGNVELSIAGSGRIEAAGKADSVDLTIAGSGDIDAAGLASQTADLSIAGSGNIRANASQSADVSIMGSGNIDVRGGAKCSVSKAGAGNVSCG